jgi:tRNA (guanine37-N1)-methyltransferase
MQIDIITIFPDMFSSPFDQSLIKHAKDKQLVSIHTHDLRRWTADSHKTVDDRPYGGGPGMVMMVEPIDKAINDLKTPYPVPRTSYVILTSAKGNLFTQTKAHELSKLDHLIFIAGHYEGVDQRVADHLVDEELSIGEYVLTGGEIPVMVMVDAIVRLLPGVVGDPESIIDESHKEPGYLEYPHYTRPEEYKGWRVPDILLSGHHAEIAKWRQHKSILQPKTNDKNHP